MLSLPQGSSFERVRAFLSSRGCDQRGRTLDELLALDDEELEDLHDYVQWLFPLPEASQFNEKAPTPTVDEFAELARDATVRNGARRAFVRMLAFYGLQLVAAGAVGKSAQWAQRSDNWAYFPTHNDLRLTRILRSLCLLGLQQEAHALLHCLEALAPCCRGLAMERPLQFWRQAVFG